MKIIESLLRCYIFIRFGKGLDPTIKEYIIAIQVAVIDCLLRCLRLRLSNLRMRFELRLLEYRFAFKKWRRELLA